MSVPSRSSTITSLPCHLGACAEISGAAAASPSRGVVPVLSELSAVVLFSCSEDCAEVGHTGASALVTVDWLLTDEVGSTQSFRCLSTVSASKSSRCCFWHTGHSKRLASQWSLSECGAQPWLICDIRDGHILPAVPVLGLCGTTSVSACSSRKQNMVMQLQQNAWSHGSLAGDESFSRQIGHRNSCMSLGYVTAAFPSYFCMQRCGELPCSQRMLRKTRAQFSGEQAGHSAYLSERMGRPNQNSQPGASEESPALEKVE
jgi:hypothetical protein